MEGAISTEIKRKVMVILLIVVEEQISTPYFSLLVSMNGGYILEQWGGMWHTHAGEAS